MDKQQDYSINMNVLFNHLERMDVQDIVNGCKEKWFNQVLTTVNDSVVRLGIVQGEFHWHKHEGDDEFFFVLEGHLMVDLEEKTIELDPGQGVTVSKGVLHRTRAEVKTVMLMIETMAIRPRGD
jgi:mannose-6-phosphate isomerase-like protein (cupin superfamily)